MAALTQEVTMKLRRLISLAVFCLVILAQTAHAQEGKGFSLIMDKCQQLIGYLTREGENLKTVKGGQVLYMCAHVETLVTCEIASASGTKILGGTRFNAEVILDDPPMLIFATANKADYFVVNTMSRSAVASIRTIESIWLGAKVCTGAFVTMSEMIEFQKKQLQR